MGELDVAQEIRVNQYKNCFIYAYIFLPWLVVSIYSELSSGFIQPPPPPLLGPTVVPTLLLALTNIY